MNENSFERKIWRVLWSIVLFFFIILGLMTLSACAEPPGVELSSLPENYFLEKERNEGNPYRVPDERESVNYEVPTSKTPEGDFIILRSVPNNLYQLSLYIDNKLICTWEHETADPRFFRDKSTVYITSATCPSVGAEIVSWEPDNLFAVRTLHGKFISFVDVWFLTGSQYFPLAK